jgi:hypothetical protein
MKFFSQSIDRLIKKYEDKKKAIKQKLQYLKFKKTLTETKSLNNIIFFTDNPKYTREFNIYMEKNGYIKKKITIYLLTIETEYNDIYMDNNYIYQDLKTVLISINKMIENDDLTNIIKHMNSYSIVCKNDINKFMTFIIKNGINIFKHTIEKGYCTEKLTIYAKEINYYNHNNILDYVQLGCNIEDEINLTDYIMIDREIYNPTLYNLIVYMDDKKLYTRKIIKLLEK